MPPNELRKKIAQGLREELKGAGVKRHITPKYRKGQTPKLVIDHHIDRNRIVVSVGNDIEIGLDVPGSQRDRVELAYPRAVEVVIKKVKHLL